MFKFRGFRASLDFLTGKTRHESHATSPTSIGGAYKINRDEYGRNDHVYNPPKKLHPSMVQLPKSQPKRTNKSQSTSDLVEATTTANQASQSCFDLSHNSRASKRLAKEQKKVEKQRLAEQKKQEKIASKERQKQEKQTQERIKQENKQRVSNERVKSSKKRNAPQPPQSQSINQTSPINNQINNNNQSQNITQQSHNIQRQVYSTNTLESSISRSSGPPPYGEYPEIIIDDANNGNISFGKPVDYNSSWDLISQHREEMRKPTASAPIAPKRKRDLQYKVGNLQIGTAEGNSDA